MDKPDHYRHSLRAEAPIAPMLIRAAGVGEITSAAARSDLLAKLRAGEFAGPLTVSITSYVQRATPNRNFVRFGRGTLRRGAHSFKGQVALVDHAQREQAARIGTILSSKAERNAAGEIGFHKELEIVKIPAIESVLDGTIDRWSIGWFPTGPIDCSACKGPMFGRNSTCPHWPGDLADDGAPVEAVYTSWEGVEVSAVNVPAVLGTGVDEIRAALAADREDRNRRGRAPQEKPKMDIEALRAILAMPATATEAEILAEFRSRQERLTAAERDRDAARATALNAMIEGAYADGRLTIARDPAGARIPSALETQIRGLDPAAAEAILGALPRNHPNGPGATPQGGSPAPIPADPALAAGADARGDVYLANPKLAPMLDRMGLTTADVAAYGPQHRRRMADTGLAPPNLARLFRTRYVGDNGAAK